MSLTQYQFLDAYNPWWNGGEAAFAGLPEFHRDVFDDLYADIQRLPQMISVTGPRRVGKSTLLRQCIRKLIQEHGKEQAQRIVYFTMDDPALLLPHVDMDRFFEDLVAEFATRAKDGTVYLFLDEIQKFPRWELYLKKHYDLKTPVRFVVSGSASAPIFRKSRESLLGRIHDYSVLPFSFREFYCFTFLPSADHNASREMLSLGNEIRKNRTPKEVVTSLSRIVAAPKNIDGERLVGEILNLFFFEGGFPEVWKLPDILAKQEYLYQNQIERVIFEDLLVAAEFRKPEMLRRFYLGLLAEPGRETNITKLAKDIAIAPGTITTYFPLLEATDLVWRLHKYTGSKATAKAGNFKSYLVDLAVRNAVMKLTPERLLADEPVLGLYAENIVANHLSRWPGLVELAYYRERNNELDFIVDLGATRIGIEVKYRATLNENELNKSRAIAETLGCEAFVVVCKKRPDESLEKRLQEKSKIPLAVVPLADFLLLF
ncbi:MAG: ATP-binding protein [Nitrosomonadales bacterium]|nr:ATP-binding protein [Nitrosomonadales bacterium]